jgi:hypothetical protein
MVIGTCIEFYKKENLLAINDNKFFFQDLADKPQYNLVVEAGTSSVSYFSNSDVNTNRDAAVIW